MRFGDLYTKIILTIIALCLMALVMQTGLDFFSSSAEAKLPQRKVPQVEVYPIGNIIGDDIKEVVTLGDQHTFIVRLDKGIKVYRVDYVRE